MELADLADHRSSMEDPISTTYRNHTVYEVPPPTAVCFPIILSLHAGPEHHVRLRSEHGFATLQLLMLLLQG